ncbi:uncharacterized protein PG986_014662 [Apiospora aurea]|uniref:Uncharacterized protein n=1 Tax=Apiospora aurea TaxID=335848 RepID=A0ABR1PUL0_9PEZI
MQPENATKDVVPTTNEEISMLDTDTVGECDRNCKKHCMNAVTGQETYDMSLDSCDMSGLEDMETQLPIAPCPDMEVFLLHDETPQDVQQPIDPSTWEMGLVEAYADMSMSAPVTPVAPDYVWPHGGPFLPPTEPEQEPEQDEEPHRPREPFAAVDYPQPIVQSYGPPPWYGEPFLFDEGIDVSYAGEDQGASMDPLGHEQWASPGVSPMSTEHDLVSELSLTFDIGTPTLSGSGYGTCHHSVDGDDQNPTSADEEDPDWDNVPYQSIPAQVLCIPFATLLELNKSFRDLIELQWPEVIEMYAQLPCRDVLASFPTIRGLATMFNLRLPDDTEKDAEWEWEEEQKEEEDAPVEDAREDAPASDPQEDDAPVNDAEEADAPASVADEEEHKGDDDADDCAYVPPASDDDDDDDDLQSCDPEDSDADDSMSFVLEDEDEDEDDMDMDYEPWT